MIDDLWNIGLNFFGTVFIVFLILKLVGAISWSWWWVTAPIWSVFLFVVLLSLNDD